ncbi:MAG: MMPL family transporter [Marmoricola sp.]
MFAALGRFVTRFPWLVVAGWIVMAVLVISFAPKLTSTSDSSSFLPKHYESIRAADIESAEFPTATQPGAIIVFDKSDGSALTAADSTKIQTIASSLTPKLDKKVFANVVAQPKPSPNNKVQLAVVGLRDKATGFDDAGIKAAKSLRADLEPLVKGSGLRAQTTGTAPQSLDNQDSSQKTMQIVGLVTVLLIVVLLALIFRSVIICLMPVAVVGLVSQIAIGLIAWANKIFDLKADSSVEIILIVVLFGIGTDYILFLLFRYREALRAGQENKEAMRSAITRAGEAIASAGGAVIVSFMALILSSLSIFKSIGPALAIAVAVTLVAALTLVPAVVTLLGTKLFWPSKKWGKEPEGARFAAIGASLGRRPGTYAVASGLALAVLAIFALGFNPTFDFNSSLPKNVESTKALNALQKGFPSGATDPAKVVLSSTDGKPITAAEFATFTQDFSTGAKGSYATVIPGAVSPSGKAGEFGLVLKDDPGSDASINALRGPIRTAAHQAAPDGTRAYVGGITSVYVDMDKAMKRDYSVVFPVAAAIIMLILALLLRSLVAPLYLMVSVGLGFGATLGATVILIEHIKGDSGLIFLLPIYIYLFVVALGTDYNILMIARLREEAQSGKDSRSAAAEAVKHAGPTIAAAGMILAGTFASLILGGNSLIVSLGFALSFGIFVASFVMAMFFTPALTALIGHAAWWPGHGDESDEDHFARTGEHYAHHH